MAGSVGPGDQRDVLGGTAAGQARTTLAGAVGPQVAHRGGGDTHHHHSISFNVQALDAGTVKSMLIDNKGTIAEALRQHMRNSGHLVPNSI